MAGIINTKHICILYKSTLLIQQRTYIAHIFTFCKQNIITTATHSHTFFSICCQLCYLKRHQTFSRGEKCDSTSARNLQQKNNNQNDESIKCSNCSCIKHLNCREICKGKKRIIIHTKGRERASARARLYVRKYHDLKNSKSKLQCNWIQNKLKRVKSFRTGIASSFLFEFVMVCLFFVRLVAVDW